MRKFSNNTFVSFIKWFTVAAALYHILNLIFISSSIIQFRAIHTFIGLTLVFLLMPARKNSLQNKPSVIDWALVLMSASATIYMIIYESEIVWRVGIMPTTADVVFGTLLIIAVLEATRRSVGLPLAALVVAFLVYAFFGGYLPDFLLGRNISYSRVISFLFSLDAGIYGTPIGVSSSYVFLFLLFGAFLTKSKTGDFYLDVAMSAGGKYRGGPAKIAISASALFGTICGTGIANVVTTGTFTIPLMKKHGFDPITAASVEAVASTGGMIMPPIMGAGAFILAESIGMPYGDLIKAAALPALIYYITLYFIIDFYAAKNKLAGLPPDEIPKFLKVISNRWYLMVPIMVLLYFLLIAQVSAIRSAFFSIIAVIVFSWFGKDTRLDFSKIVECLIEGVNSSLGVIAACAAAAIVTGLVGITGLGLKFTAAIIALAGNSLLLALIFTMLITLVLSMGLNATSAYIVSAALVAPVLIKLGLSPLQSHFFIFYFACFSCITPPVCLVAYPAAALAETDPFKVGLVSFVMAMPAYIIPFMAAYGPGLLLVGTTGEIIRVAITSIIGAVCLAATVQSWFFRNLHIIERIIYGGATLLLFNTGLTSDIYGLSAIAILSIFVFITRRSSRFGGLNVSK